MSRMAGQIYVQDGEPIQGWGTGFHGEEQFSTTYAPYAQQNPFFEDSDSEEEDETLDPYDAIYGEVTLEHVHGQQLAIWSHKMPDTLALFTPIPGDNFVTLVAFARTTLQFNSAVDKIMVLLPGHKRPLDMDHVFVVKPGTAVLIVPLYDYMINLEVKQLGHQIDMVVNLTMTVLELKSRLQTERGYPATRMELLYRDRPMENSRFLFEYSLAHSSNIFVLMTLKHDLLVHVETFWGKKYHLHVDPCSTGFGIIASVLRRTVSQTLVDVVRLYELFLPKHTLVLYVGSRALDWDTCLGFYNIENGSVLRLTTIGLAHDMAIQHVPVTIDAGRPHHVMVSKFDRWSAVVLKLHGMTGYPVNLMRLVRHSNHTVDFSDTVGSMEAQGGHPVRLDITGMSLDDDLLYGIPLKFKVTRGVTELLKVAPNRSVKSVKDTLEKVGVPNAAVHDLELDGLKLHNTKRVVDVVEEYKRPIDVVLRQYPVFIHGPQNVIYKMLANSKETLATFLMRIKMKTGLSFNDHEMLMCGAVLDEDENTPVFSTRVSVKSSVFLIPRKHFKVFLILNGDWLTKLRLEASPSPKQIKETLWKERNVPEGGLASIGNFLQWFFGAPNWKDEKSSPKEKDILYQENVGDRYMTMRVERPKRNVKHDPMLNEQMHGLDLGHLEDYRLQNKGRHFTKPRARSQPPGKLTVRRSKIPVPRHLSSVNGVSPERHNKRKSFTTMPEDRQPRRVIIPKRKRKQTERLRVQHEYRNDRGHPGDRNDVTASPKGEDEWVFALRHDYTVKSGQQRRGWYRYT